MTFPVIFRGRNNITQSGPQPTGERFSAVGQANATDILSILPANFDLQPFNKWHGFAWVYFNELPTLDFTSPINQGGAVANDATWALAASNFGPIAFVAPFWAFDGFNNVQFNAVALDWLTNFGTLAVDTWYLVDWWVDWDTLEIGIRVNGDSVTGKTVDVIAGTSPTTVDEVRCFTVNGGVIFNESPFSGRLGGCGIRAGSLWTDAEMQYMYNAGCQILYGEMNTGLFPTILDDIFAWWDMQEDTGENRVNIEGTAARDFVNNGVVPRGCGTCWTCDAYILGAQSGVEFPNTLTDYLSVPNADFVLSGQPVWHACGWFQVLTMPAAPGDKIPLIGQFDDTTVDSAFQLYLTDDGSGPVLAFCIVGDDGAESRFDILNTTWRTNFGPMQTATWYFWDIWYDGSVSQLAQIRMDAGAMGADALFMGGSPGVTGSTPHDLLLGEFSGGAAGPTFFGSLSSVAFRIGSRWSDDQISWIKNVSCGIQFSDLAFGPGDISDGLYAFWNLDELSGTRVNSQGSSTRDLAETGSLTQSTGPCGGG